MLLNGGLSIIAPTNLLSPNVLCRRCKNVRNKEEGKNGKKGVILRPAHYVYQDEVISLLQGDQLV